MLKFQHILQVNDLSNPDLTIINRDQLWHGLVTRCHNPVLFQLGLERCDILSEVQQGTCTLLKRQLDFGPFKVHDEVLLDPLQSVCTSVAASDNWPQSQALIHIEEPELNSLFLRFSYEWQQDEPNTSEEKMMHELRVQAYIASDNDLLRLIRQLESPRH